MEMELSQSSLGYVSPPPYVRTDYEPFSPGPLTSTPTKVPFQPFDEDSIPELPGSSSNESDAMSISDISLVSTDSETEVNPKSPGESLTTTLVQAHPSIPGYKIVFDNIDKTVRPRQMRIDCQNKSLHYVHLYGVKNRIDFSALPDTPPVGMKNLSSLLPTNDDDKYLKDNFSVLVARVIVDNIPFFEEDRRGLVTRHILHKYSKEMSVKSEVVSTGSIIVLNHK